MAITATVKYNDLRDTKNGQKRALKVEASGQSEMVTIWLNPDQGEHYKKGDQISIEQKGAFWNMCKDQSAPGAPMSTTPATVTNGQGYTPPSTASKEAMIAWGEQCTDLYLHIFNKITLSPEFAAQDVPIQKEAAATVFIAAARRFERP